MHYRKVAIACLLAFVLIFTPSFMPDDTSKKSGNLKVLPKDISEEELMLIMKDFNKSLGVNAGFAM